MLQTLIMLVLGSSALEAPRFDPRELSDAIEAGTSSLEDAEARLLLADIGELRRIGDELGDKLIGTVSDDFEERLAVLFDEEKFARFLGGISTLARNVLNRPDLARMLESELDPLPATMPGTVGAKFTEDCERLFAILGNDPFNWLRDQKGHVELGQVISLDPATMGRQLLEEIYDPATTPRMASIAKSIVRFVARMLVVRHVALTHSEPTPDYIAGLFEKSAHDVENLGSLIVSTMNPPPAHGFPKLDLRLESVMKRMNQWVLRQAMPRWPGPTDSNHQA